MSSVFCPYSSHAHPRVRAEKKMSVREQDYQVGFAWLHRFMVHSFLTVEKTQYVHFNTEHNEYKMVYATQQGLYLETSKAVV